MDEPTEGLALRFVEVVLDIASSLRESGELGILIVVQEVPIALSIADRIYVMGKGHTVFDGTPAALAERHDIQERYIGVGV